MNRDEIVKIFFEEIENAFQEWGRQISSAVSESSLGDFLPTPFGGATFRVVGALFALPDLLFAAAGTIVTRIGLPVLSVDKKLRQRVVTVDQVATALGAPLARRLLGTGGDVPPVIQAPFGRARKLLQGLSGAPLSGIVRSALTTAAATFIGRILVAGIRLGSLLALALALGEILAARTKIIDGVLGQSKRRRTVVTVITPKKRGSIYRRYPFRMGQGTGSKKPGRPG